VLAVVNGDVEATGVNTIDQAPKSGGRNSSNNVRIHRKSKKVARIPVLAGEVASGLKMRHGMLIDSVENQQLIRADAARRIEALRRDADPMFVNLRNHDMHLVVMHASKMYWIMSDDEEYVQELYSKRTLASLRASRNKVAVSPTSC
jgi:PHD/YefM family antitoxin component YafN of YafNO toxin-antitoxin module